MILKKKIISFILPSLGGGGTEKVYLNLALYLFSKGFEIHFVLLEKKGELLKYLPIEIFVYSLNKKRFRNSIFSLVQYFKTQKPNYVLASMWPLTSISVIAWILAGKRCKLFLSEHSNLTETYLTSKIENAFFLKLLIRITYPYVNGVICVSNGVLEDIISMGRLKRDKIKVIYNPVTNDRFNNDIVNEIPDFWRDCSFKILSIGRFVSQKNHALLLNAFCILRKSVDAKLIILGDGPLYLQTKEYLNKLGLVDSVIMPGFTTDTNPFYYHSNLFVLSSNFEGLPTVLIEALDYGISIVSTDCPSGPSEILSNGIYGTLVPVGDAEKLAFAMQQSLLNPRDKISLKERAKDFSVEKMSELYLSMFLNF